MTRQQELMFSKVGLAFGIGLVVIDRIWLEEWGLFWIGVMMCLLPLALKSPSDQ